MSRPLAAEIDNEIQKIISRYPRREAALLPVLQILERASGVISPVEEEQAAEILGLSPVKIREVSSFYSLLKIKGAGEHTIRVCRNLSCSLAGAEKLLNKLQEKLGICPGETTPDGKISLFAVECLGNCDQAPCFMVDSEDHHRVTEQEIDRILEKIRGKE